MKIQHKLNDGVYSLTLSQASKVKEALVNENLIKRIGSVALRAIATAAMAVVETIILPGLLITNAFKLLKNKSIRLENTKELTNAVNAANAVETEKQANAVVEPERQANTAEVDQKHARNVKIAKWTVLGTLVAALGASGYIFRGDVLSLANSVRGDVLSLTNRVSGDVLSLANRVFHKIS